MKKYLLIILSFICLFFTLSFKNNDNISNLPVELTEFRTVNQKVYKLPNGQYEFKFFNSAVHYWNLDHFEEFDNTFKENTNSLKTISSNYQATLPKILNQSKGVTLSCMDLYDIEILFENQLSNSIFNLCSFEKNHLKEKDILNPMSKLSGLVSYNTLEEKVFYEQTSESFLYKQTINNFKSIVTSNFIIYTDNLMLSEDNKLINNFGMPIYQIGKQYLIDSNGKIIYPDQFSVNKIEKGFEISVSYDILTINKELEYPLVSINAINNCMNSSPTYIRDKYVKIGFDDVYEDERLYAGVDPIGYLPPNGTTPINDVYKSFLELSLPGLTKEDIASAKLEIYKANSTSNPLYNPDLNLRRITNKTFDDINGNSTYNSLFVEYAIGAKTYYPFDITSAVKDQLSVSNKLLLEIEGLPNNIFNTGLASFYSSNDTGNNQPSFSIEIYDFDPSLYGSATPYVPMSGYGFNCFGYAINEYDEWIEPDYENLQIEHPLDFSNYGYYIQLTIDKMTSYNVAARVIPEVDSFICENERRIAFRIGDILNVNYTSFHFMKQHIDGSWSHKPGAFPTVLFGQGITPDNLDIWDTKYNSDIAYFAIYNV